MAIDTLQNYERSLFKENKNLYGQNTWDVALGNINTNKQIAEKALETSYGKAVAEAYTSAQKQKSAVASSDLFSGYKESAYDEIDSALNDAYNTYMSKLSTGKQELEKTANEQKENVYSALSEQAQNTMDLRNTVEDYRNFIYNYFVEHANDEGVDNIFATNPNWNKYLVEVPENTPLSEDVTYMNLGEGDDMRTYRLKTIDELNYDFFDENNNLTVAGVDYYDQMLNEFANKAGSDVPSFDKYLAQTNPELYDWARSTDPYNYTKAGTNLGSFKTLFGMTSKDYKYNFIERYGGLSEKQLNSMFDTFNNKLQTLVNKSVNIRGGQSEQLILDTKDILEDLQEFSKKLGIDEDINWDEVNSTINTTLEEVKNNGEMTADWFLNFVTTGGISALPISASLSWLPNGIGALIGVAAGAAIGATSASVKTAKQNKLNKEDAKKVTDYAYSTILESLIKTSQEKRAKTQNNFGIR